MELIKKYFPGLSDAQLLQFESLQPLYQQWNAAINVISRKDIEHLYERHILHSLAIAKVIRFADGSYILDVGTGGGFPGIPLAILFPESQFHLIDSIGKKIKVVNEVATELGLKNVTSEQIRAEQVVEKFDFIVSRAVTSLPEFTQWTRKNITRRSINPIHNGIIYLKGGDVSSELRDSGGKYQVYHLDRYFEEPFFETKSAIHLWF